MTSLPPPSTKKLGLVIDLDTCVGCHACAVACKEWNDGGQFGPLPDENPYGKEPLGVWFNRVHSYEVHRDEGQQSRDEGRGARGRSRAVRCPNCTRRIPAQLRIKMGAALLFPRPSPLAPRPCLQ